MKTIKIFTLTVTALIALQTTGQVFERELFVDTAKLVGKTYLKFDRFNPRKFLSQEEINALYFYDFEIIHNVFQSHGSPGEIGEYKDFENYKALRYEIKDNRTFNELLPKCKFFYEYSKFNHQERVIAQYNGKFFRYEDFNYLMREMGKGELPQIAKTKILAQWRLWMFDQDIHIMSMDTVEYKVPGKRKIVESERKPYAYDGNKYVVRYSGEIEINGILYEYSSKYWNDKRTIHYFTAYYPTRENYITVALRCKNIYSTQNKSSNDIEIIHNGTQVLPKIQDGKSVLYYTNNSGNVQIKYTDVSDLGDQTKFRFYASTGAEVSDIIFVHETEILQVGMSVDYDLTNVLSSGMYLIKYEDQNGVWKLIQDVVLIPEEIDATHTIAGTNFTLELHYLEQSFDSEVDMNLYVSQMKSTFDEVMGKWIGDSEKKVNILVEFKNQNKLF